MTPEAVIDRYLATAMADPFDPAAFAMLLGTDADLLSRWLQLLACPADPAAFVERLRAIPPARFRDLAISQALSVLTVSGSVRLSFDQWQSVLNTSLVGELLATELGLDDPVGIRWRVLLAASGVNLADDPLLMELLTFRGARRELLEDASLIHRLFAVVDALDVADPLISRETVRALLGIGPERYEVLLADAEARCTLLIERLGLAPDDGHEAAERLWLRMQIDMLGRQFPAAPSPKALKDAHDLACRRLFGREAALFLIDDSGERLVSIVGTGPDIAIASGSSVIARCARLGERCELVDRADQAVADRQVLRQLGSAEGVCLALRDDVGATAGVVVFAMDDDVDQDTAMALYAEELARRLRRAGGAAPAGPAGDVARFRATEEQRLRELVHEVNNPLSIVTNYLHILEGRLGADQEAVEQLRMIGGELRRASDLISQARIVPDDSARVERSVPVQTVDLNGLVRQIMQLHTGYASEHRVTLGTDLTSGELQVPSDEQRLAQILNNLVRNAIEAAGGGEVTVATIKGVFRDVGEGVLVEVADTGPGLPRDALLRLTEPKQSSKGGGHAGLGLHIVYRLVGELGASIDVRTVPLQGTRFSVFLPLIGLSE